MNDRIARGLSWGAALLCVHYIVWGGRHVLRFQMPALAQSFAGIGMEQLPVTTRFILEFSDSYIWPTGAFLILLVVSKEFLVRDTRIRLMISFLILFSVAWFLEFAVSSMLVEPVMRGILERAR